MIHARVGVRADARMDTMKGERAADGIMTSWW